MSRIRLSAASLACTLLVAVAPVAAEDVTVSSTDVIIDFPPGDNPTPTQLPGSLPFSLFDFSGQQRIDNLVGMSLTMTIEDGDTDPGDMDFDQLSLGLDGIDTGLKLNGFGAGEEVTQTLSWSASEGPWMDSGTVEALMDSLADGKLVASILDASPGDNFVNLYSAFDSELQLTGMIPGVPGGTGDPVPEPASLLLWGLAGGGLLWYRRRKS